MISGLGNNSIRRFKSKPQSDLATDLKFKTDNMWLELISLANLS